MKIFYIYRTSRNEMLRAFEKGKDPSTLLYGLVELRKLGLQVEFSDIAYSRFNLLNYLLLPLERLFIFLIKYPLGYKLHQALILLPQYHKYDVIICTQDSAGLPILLLKRLGLIKQKIIYICNNLTPLLNSSSNQILTNFLIWHLNSADSIICFSKVEQKIINNYITKGAKYIPFAIDTQFYHSSPTTNYQYDLLAVGKDLLRDYSTFIQAVKNTNWKIAIICSPNNMRGIKLPINVKVLFDISQTELRNYYLKSKLVVIPMRNAVIKSQGQIVLLEATAMKKPVIASNVPGLTTAFNINQFKHLTLVKPNDHKLLQASIAKIFSHNLTIKPNSKALINYISMKRFGNDLYKTIIKYEK